MNKLTLLSALILTGCTEHLSGDLKHFETITKETVGTNEELNTERRITSSGDTITAYSRVYNDSSIGIEILEVIEHSTYTYVSARETYKDKDLVSMVHSQGIHKIKVEKIKFPIVFDIVN
jgi:hypothetical protein